MNAEKCQTACYDSNIEFVFIQAHNNGVCKCFKTCNYARPATAYESKARVYEYASNNIERLGLTETISDSSWILRADNNQGDAGCSDTTQKHFFGMWNEETCQTACYDRNIEFVFIQTYDNGVCKCFKTCNYARPAAAYESKARVYEYASINIERLGLTERKESALRDLLNELL